MTYTTYIRLSPVEPTSDDLADLLGYVGNNTILAVCVDSPSMPILLENIPQHAAILGNN